MANNTIAVEFVLRGIQDIGRAMRTVEQSATAADRARERTAAQGAKQRTRIEEQEAKAKIRAMLQADRFQRQAQERAARDAERAAKQRLKADERTTREAERGAKQRLKAEEREMRGMVQAAEKAANERLRIERKVDREFAALQKKQARERDKIIADDDRKQAQQAARMARIRERSATMAGRYAAREAEKEIAARQRFARGTADRFMSAGKTGIQQAVGLAGKAAGTVAQLGGGFSIADAVKEMGELEKSAVRFSNAAFVGKGSRVDPKQLEAEAKAASITTGINPNELMAGAHAFLAKVGPGNNGDGMEARTNMKLFGEIATGTGANIEDVAKAAGTLRVQNADLDPEAMKSILLQTVRQGQKGSIEFSDLATSVGKITRTSGGYVGKQEKTQAELLGIAQLGMATMSDPRDVATSLAGIEGDTKKHWQDMEGTLGKDTFDSMGRIKKGPSEFIADVMEKSGGDTRKLQDMGFGKQSMKFFQALAPEFQKAGGGKAGRDALLTKMKDAVAEPMGYGELQTNVSKVLNTSAMQFETSMMQLKIAVGEQLMPEFLKLVPVLRDAMPAIKDLLTGFVKLANWAANNPLLGLGALMGAAFAKEMAIAGISKLLQAAIATQTGTALTGATFAIASAVVTIKAIADAQTEEQRNSLATSTAAASAAAGVRSGDATTQDQLDKLTAQRDAVARQAKAERAGVNDREAIQHVGTAGRLASMALGPLGFVGQKIAGVQSSSESDAEYQKAREERLRQSEQALKDMDAAIKRATENLNKLGAAAKTADGAGAPAVPRPPAASTGIVQRTQ